MTVLRERMTQDMQIRNLSWNTQNSYLQQVSQFARYFDQSPAGLLSSSIRVSFSSASRQMPRSVLAGTNGSPDGRIATA